MIALAFGMLLTHSKVDVAEVAASLAHSERLKQFRQWEAKAEVDDAKAEVGTWPLAASTAPAR